MGEKSDSPISKSKDNSVLIKTGLLVFATAVLAGGVGFTLGGQAKEREFKNEINKSLESFGDLFSGLGESWESEYNETEYNLSNKEINDILQVEDLEIRVDNTYSLDQFESEWGDIQKPAEGAKFFVVELEVENKSKSTDYFSMSDYIRFQDSNDRNFELTTMFYDIEGAEDISYANLAPGIKKSGFIAFELPSDVSKGDLQIYFEDLYSFDTIEVIEGYQITLDLK